VAKVNIDNEETLEKEQEEPQAINQGDDDEEIYFEPENEEPDVIAGESDPATEKQDELPEEMTPSDPSQEKGPGDSETLNNEPVRDEIFTEAENMEANGEQANTDLPQDQDQDAEIYRSDEDEEMDDPSKVNGEGVPSDPLEPEETEIDIGGDTMLDSSLVLSHL